MRSEFVPHNFKPRLLPLFLLPLFVFTVLTGCASEAPRNVLLIMVDDLAPALGVYGANIETPYLDQFANEGWRFDHAYCQQAVCAPSRASTLTGLYPDETRVWDLKTKLRGVSPQVVTLPEWFRDNGYVTAGVGKIFDMRSVDKAGDEPSWAIPYEHSWKLPYFNPETGSPAAAHYQDRRIHELDQEAIDYSGGDWLKRVRYLRERGAFPAWERMDVPDDAYEDSVIATQAVKWLEGFAEDEEPFFLAVGFKKPHLPFVAPEKYWALYDDNEPEAPASTARAVGSPDFAYHQSDELRGYSGIPRRGEIPEAAARTMRQGYYATVSYIDAQVGRVLSALEEQGLKDSTMVVLLSDHGFHLGDHGIWCKHTNLENATRVPLLMRVPGSAVQVVDEPVELIDVFPTLCQWAGIDPPSRLPGNSLFDEPSGEPAMSQYPRDGHMGYSLRSEQFRYTAWYSWDKASGKRMGSEPIAEEFFDYASDPHETINAINAPEYGRALDGLRKKLKERIASLKKEDY